MSRVNLEGVSVHIPVYDANTLRLLRMPKFGRAKVGSRNVSHAGARTIIHALSDIAHLHFSLVRPGATARPD